MALKTITLRESWEKDPMVFIDTFKELVRAFNEQIENDTVLTDHERNLLCVKKSIRALCFPYSRKESLTVLEIHNLSKELTDKLIFYEATGTIEF
jgi:hypothetical protein